MHKGLAHEIRAGHIAAELLLHHSHILYVYTAQGIQAAFLSEEARLALHLPDSCCWHMCTKVFVSFVKLARGKSQQEAFLVCSQHHDPD